MHQFVDIKEMHMYVDVVCAKTELPSKIEIYDFMKYSKTQDDRRIEFLYDYSNKEFDFSNLNQLLIVLGSSQKVFNHFCKKSRETKKSLSLYGFEETTGNLYEWNISSQKQENDLVIMNKHDCFVHQKLIYTFDFPKKFSVFLDENFKYPTKIDNK